MKKPKACDLGIHHQQCINRPFQIGILLNLIFVLIEFYFGFFHNSLALLSDALHNLGDVLGLAVVWLGAYLAARSGSKKISNVTALINTLFVTFSAVFIMYEAYLRWWYPQAEPVAKTIIFVASVGFVINFYTAKLFHHDHDHDLNIKSAYLHLLSDAIISLGVVMAGIVIYFTSLYWIDPLISVIISLVILYGSLRLLKEIFLQMKSS